MESYVRVNLLGPGPIYMGTGPSSYEGRIYRAAVSRRLRNTALESCKTLNSVLTALSSSLCMRYTV